MNHKTTEIMKRNTYIFLAVLASSLMLVSCEETPLDPVPSCNIGGSVDYNAYPNNDLYQDILDDYVSLGLPGVSVAIETPDHGWWVGCAGMASIEDDIPMEPCHLHPSSGMAVPYMATLVFRLYEDELLELDDPISDYLPEEMVSRIANGEDATIRQVLGHKAGFDDVYYGEAALRDVLNNPFAERTTESNFEEYFYDRKAVAAPGEEFRFSDAGYDLLGMVIEQASGKSLAAYFHQEITGPLGLSHTFHKNAPGYPDLPDLVNGYIEIYPRQIQNITHVDMTQAQISTGHIGIRATPVDYATFYRELLSGNVLEPATLEIMMSERTELNDTLSYCLGIANRQKAYGEVYEHRGILYGIDGQTSYYPVEGITFSMITNLGRASICDMGDLFLSMVDEMEKVIFTGER